MKRICVSDKTEYVPERVRKFFVIAACLMLAATSVYTGTNLQIDEKKIPVLLADGSVITKPWYITVDGEKTVLVQSEDDAEKTLQNIVDRYQKGHSNIIEIEVKENTSAQQMNLKNGDEVPRILSVEEAERALIDEEINEQGITVLTKEEKVIEEKIEYQSKYKITDELYQGNEKIEVEGKEGRKDIKKIITRENGKIVEEEIVNETVLEEPVDEIILKGVKNRGGYGGGEYTYDSNVSHSDGYVFANLSIPVSDYRISSEYGMRWGRLHRGVDFALPTGESILAADAGYVYFSGYCGGYGNLIKVDHGNGIQTYYAHCSSLIAENGQYVDKGDIIALVGSTGNSTGPHLHFEIIVNGECVNPRSFMSY